MIPDGWEKTTLNDICQKIGDGIHSTPKYVEDSSIRFINGNNLLNGIIDSKSAKYISEDEFRKYTQSLGFNTILLSINGTIGNLAIYNGERVLLGKSAAFINVNNEKVDRIYVYYLLQSAGIKRFFDSELTGSTIRNLSLKTIRQTPVALPNYDEQQCIVEILSTWDRAIETTEKLIANSEAQKKALMQQLLTGKKRLPGFEGEWSLTPLAAVGETSSGGTPDSNNPDYWDGDVAWATPTDITALSSRHISQTERNISLSGLKNSSAKLLPADSLIICTRATVGQAAIATLPIATNQGFKNIIPHAEYDVDFLYYLLAYFQNTLVRAACGSTFLELSKKDFDKISFEIPSIEEQIEISNVLSMIDTTIERIQEKLRYLVCEKSALMQQLLTGKRRVAIDKEQAA